jgi:hypothetical protein
MKLSTNRPRHDHEAASPVRMWRKRKASLPAMARWSGWIIPLRTRFWSCEPILVRSRSGERSSTAPHQNTAGRKILVVEGYRITHMTWNPAGDHHHQTDVTYVKPDGSQATISADRLPFVIEGDVTVETIGVVVRSGVCTTCGQRVMPSTR